MITYTDFIIDFPEFSNTAQYSQERVNRFIGKASAQVDESLELADEIVGNLTAHLLALNDMARENAIPGAEAGGAQRIASLSVQGEYSVQYVSNTRFESLRKGSSFGSGGAINSFDLTPYGMEFQRLLRLAGWGPQVV